MVPLPFFFHNNFRPLTLNLSILTFTKVLVEDKDNDEEIIETNLQKKWAEVDKRATIALVLHRQLVMSKYSHSYEAYWHGCLGLFFYTSIQNGNHSGLFEAAGYPTHHHHGS